MTDTKHIRVAVDLPLSLNTEDTFYYSVPEEIKDDVISGSVVRIPFGKQELNGFVLETLSQNGSTFPKGDFKIRPIYEVTYKKQIWEDKFIELARWISKYYLTNIGTVLSASISAEILDHSTHEVELTEGIKDLSKLTDEQKFIMKKFLISKKKSLSYRFLQQKSKFNNQRFYQIINQLKNKGIIRTKIKNQKSKLETQKSKLETQKSKLPPKARLARGGETQKSSSSTSLFVLNKDQQNAFDTILKSIQATKEKTYLLHGVTGSGKTEVYLRLIEEVLKNNKTVIYLVPEIYLVTQAYERLKDRFDPSSIIIWHSTLTKSERLNNWENLDEAKIILGARSAILAPIKNLGLIVIDEAHDSSYKQASPTPRYDAIKVGIKRGEIEKCPVILGSATPNIADYYHCIKNHTVLELPNRIENYPMPTVYKIDLKEEYPKTNKNIISNALRNSINEALSKREQVILLLNRRGYASHIFCRACGYIQFCKNCSVPMVFHKNLSLMICHHCGYKTGINSEFCPKCKSPHFKYFGLGTQQLEEEVKGIFQSAKIIRVDSDQLRKKDQYISLWQEFAAHRADILIGTQLVAKGLDLPNVTVVGVILADTMLNFPDYISHERAFQLLTQVTGRTGRGEKPGKVFIQTYQNENPIFNFIQEHDFDGFYKNEMIQREQFSYPPFTQLLRIIFQSYDENECINHANKALGFLTTCQLPSSPVRQLARSPVRQLASSPVPQFEILGPAPCFFSKLHGKYRYHILCKIKPTSSSEPPVHGLLINNLFERHGKNAKVETIIDVDSLNLL